MPGIGRSKLANILFAKNLQRRLDEEGYDIIVTSLHPGNIRTGKSVYFLQLHIYIF